MGAQSRQVEKVQFEHQLLCYIPWDLVVFSDDLHFTFPDGTEVRVYHETTEDQDPSRPKYLARVFATAVCSNTMRSTGKLCKLLSAFSVQRVPVELLDEQETTQLCKEEPQAYQTRVLPAGRVLAPTAFPNYYRNHSVEMTRRLVDPIEQVLDLLAHRVAGLPAAYGPTMRLLRLRRPPAEDWVSLPCFAHSGGSLSVGIAEINDGAVADVQAAIDSLELCTFVGYSLFREAWGALLGFPRAAFITGFAALEVGCKEWLSLTIPETKWLVDNLQSPPLHRLLREYIVPLIERQGAAETAAEVEALAPTIEKHAHLRNRLAHGGVRELSVSKAKAALRQMETLYWLLQVATRRAGAEEALLAAKARR